MKKLFPVAVGLVAVAELKKELRDNGFKFKYESNGIKNTLLGGNGTAFY